jgi:hypothetical protein
MGDMDWIDVAVDGDRRRAVMNAVMNLRFHKMWGICWLAEDLLASQDGLCSMEIVSYLFSCNRNYNFKNEYAWIIDIWYKI